MSASLRIYNPEEVGPEGYPFAWDHDHWQDDRRCEPIKDQIRRLADHRCERCGHPYLGRKRDERISQAGQWSPCDKRCTHGAPWRTAAPDGIPSTTVPENIDHLESLIAAGWLVQAQWRILTVHHLNGIKWDCRWWNLASLCQRCHLTIQGKVYMDREFVREHTEWFKPHAAGWYAAKYLGEDLSRAATLARLNELLDLERTWDEIPGLAG